MNRDLTKKELDCIKRHFNEFEFRDLTTKISNRLRLKDELLSKEKLMKDVSEMEGTDRVDLVNNGDEDFDFSKSIIYDYKNRKNIKIVISNYTYGYILTLKTLSYVYEAKGFNDLTETIPKIHKAIDDGII